MSTTEFEHLRLERLDDAVSRLTLNRPERMNSVTAQTFAELAEAARVVRHDGTRALIVTGAGERAFCAGYDLAEVSGLRSVSVPAFLDIEDVASGAVHALAALPFPVIAAVNGAASGGGLSLALAADIRIAAATAVFNAAFVRIGFSVGELGTSWMLSRLLGPGMAAELSFTGRIVDATEAAAIGLITRVAAPEDLPGQALALARQVAAVAANGADGGMVPAVGINKRSMRRAAETSSYASWMDDVADGYGPRP